MNNSSIKFYEKRKVFFLISLSIILIGIIFNFIFGTKLDIQFTGGAVMKYSYVGDINSDKVASIIKEATGKTVSVKINEDVKNAEGQADLNNITAEFAGTDALDLEQQKAVIAKLEEALPDNNFKLVSSSSVNPTMGKTFFIKCLAAVAIAVVCLIIYIAIRFRKIGGASAGVMAIVALIHDILIVYFVFIVFRIPLNDSFIAVVLTILGYSVNDTIVAYDRIRENRRLLGSKEEISNILDISLNQVFRRSVYTSITTFVAIACVYVVGLIYNLSSITSFALPMMVGVVVGCYSSLCIAGPLFTMWQEKKLKKLS